MELEEIGFEVLCRLYGGYVSKEPCDFDCVLLVDVKNDRFCCSLRCVDDLLN